MGLVTVCMASVLVVLVAIKLKKMNAEYSTLLSIGACLFIVSFIIGRLGNVLDSIDRITGYININMEYISILLKMLGISYICEFATNICKDAGYGAIASHIELAGRVTMVVMSLPILFHVIDMVVRLMG